MCKECIQFQTETQIFSRGGFPLSKTYSGHFTLLICRGQRRNVPRNHGDVLEKSLLNDLGQQRKVCRAVTIGDSLRSLLRGSIESYDQEALLCFKCVHCLKCAKI